MSEPVNGSENPASHEVADPSLAAHSEAMDTTADGPPAELQAGIKSEADAQPEANTQPETNAQPTDAAASPRPEPNTAPADNQPRPGVETVREILNTKINPFVSAGLREIFRDPANIPEDPLRILGEFLLEKHREVSAKEGEASQAATNGAES